MIQRIRNSYLTKGFAALMIINLLAEIIQPNTLFALTGGPSQPEVQGFTPIGTSENVDLASGSFNYNIPLLDVGGYPINIAYNSGVTMDQEASWVGLGWNLNPGVLNRNMRGLPDDFSGDLVKKEFHMKDNISWGVSVAPGAEVVGFDLGGLGELSFGMGLNYNNYNGWGTSFSATPSFDFSWQTSEGNTAELGLGVSLTASDDGLNVNPNMSFSTKEQPSIKNNHTFSNFEGGFGLAFNSRQGLKSFSLSMTNRKVGKNKSGTMDDKRRGGGGTLSMPNNTYVPMVEFSKINESVSFSGKFGVGFITADGTADLSGYYSKQYLALNAINVPAYGYLHSQEGKDLQNVLHDFNREKDGAYTKGSPNLPVTNYSYDIYTAVGQGVGGMFRPYRSDIGHVYDREVTSTGNGGSLGADFASGQLVDGGLDVDVNTSTQKTKKWGNWTNKAKDKFKFKDLVAGDDFEPVYFKQVGELAVDEDPLFDNMEGFDPVAIKLKYTYGFNVKALQTLYSNTDASIPVTFATERTTGGRAKRNMLFSQLTVAESEDYALPVDGTTAYSSVIYSGAKDHHVGEVTVTRNDGVRYVYGIPAYNTTQKEATFSVDAATDDGSGLVTYDAGSDNSVNNQQGTDEFYECTTLPAYAHSYLLTAVISPDYVDLTGDGPTIDDYGTYTKFTYDKKYTSYKWRVPYEENKANFSAGLNTLNGDNKGSYVYGEKEIWYLDEIETKTHVAKFTRSERHDGHDVVDENGGIGTQATYQLDKISLFTKPDFDDNYPATSIPIKEVHFVYDYYLCPNVPNNDGATELVDGVNINLNKGKLTLREIYFSYGNSDKGKLSAYKFKYGDFDGDGIETDDNGNADYDLKDYNMWGTYKPNAASTYSVTNNAENPYVVQNKTQEDEYTAQWHLTNIVLPSGGEMKIQYESNDYTHVQNQDAMQFLKVVGCAETEAVCTTATTLGNLENELWASANQASAADRLWTVVELPSTGYTETKFIDELLKPLGSAPVRFNYQMNLKEEGQPANLYEFVTGYAKIDISNNYDNAGVTTIAGTTYGYFKFEAVPEENKDTNPDSHPIAKTAWQWVRMYNPHVAYDQTGGTVDMNTDQTGIIEAIASSFSSFAEIFNGPNGFMRNKGIGKQFNPNKSWVRFPTAENKLGGGSRVKQISLSDEWASMTGNDNEGDKYGQTYTYQNEDGTSSGIAAFEPMMSKENALITPLSYEERRFMVPNEKYVIEKPYGLSFYPAPKITYGRVEVRSLDKTYTRSSTNYSSTNRTGKTVTEYYTTKDFPTIVQQTQMDKKPFTPDLVMQLLKFNVREQANVSQGYVIETNDMDGKLKSQMVYGEDQEVAISGVKYVYGTTTETLDFSDFVTGALDDLEGVTLEYQRLDNDVLTIAPDGTVETNRIGVECDIITDFRQNRSENISAGLDGNLATFIAMLPISLPTVFPSFSRQVTRFRSAVTTKVINRFGILREVIAFDNGAAVSTENLAWDSETGEVLLTKTKNEFADPYYSINFPAHWTYDRMGQAYQNIGFVVGSMTEVGTTDYYTATGAENFVKGDEVIISYNDGTAKIEKAWVLDVINVDEVYFIKEDGTKLNATSISWAKVIRSGRRNQQSMSVGSLTMKSNPIWNYSTSVIQDLDNNSFNNTVGTNEVIAASATEFSENWGMVCGGFTSGFSMTQTCSRTALGDWIINEEAPTGDGTCSFYVFDAAGYDPNDPNNVNASSPATPNFLYYYSVTWPDWADDFSSITQVGAIEDNYSDQHMLINASYNGNPVQNYIIYVTDGPIEVGRCEPLWECGDSQADGDPTACGPQIGGTINPFVENVQGVWRPLKGWARLGARYQMDFDLASNSNQTTNIRTQGKLSNFAYFWQKSAGKWGSVESGWTWVTTITPYRGYDQDGMERENMDALYRFSTAVNGYANTLPIAVAANATYRQIAFDGFEDYDYYSAQTCKDRHFAFENATLSEYESHTGRYSMELGGNLSIGVSRILTTDGADEPAKSVPYVIRECECQGTFGPETYDVAKFAKSATVTAQSKKYVLSYWVKRDEQGPLVSTYTGIAPIVNVDGAELALGQVRRSNIIDGWQKVEYTFTIAGYTPPVSEKLISISFDNTESTIVFIDDIRIQPFNSAMKTYVYDPLNLRLMAELDDNNFATFYEYNEEGSLIRIKKETERGIVTIQESRSGIIKENL